MGIADEVDELVRALVKNAERAGYERGKAETLAAISQTASEQLTLQLNPDEDALSLRIRDIELSERARNCLIHAKIDTVGEAVAYHNEHLSAGGLTKITSFGQLSLAEVRATFAQYGVDLAYIPNGLSGD
mgnify:CR=1 FL=1